MEYIKDQILGGTLEDQQGEKLSYEFLDDFCGAFRGKRMPLNQQHDLGKKTIGYAENIRLEKIEGYKGEWHLVGDLFVDRENLEIALGGFSISGVESIRSERNPEFLLYIPYPYYNDSELLQDLSKAKNINLGKWIKKNNTPESWAIFGTTLVFFLTPMWDDFYKTSIAPRIKAFISKELPKLQKKGIGLQYVQLVNFRNFDVEIRFIGEKGKEKECYSQRVLQNSIASVELELENSFSELDPICRVVLCYDSKTQSYFVHRIEKESGVIEHYA